ncbi:Muniscin C-terminal mu homology domain-containing protein [Calycina marina]|uniref:Muniscin C-terminal mu homology domain-containing protein n=1 Tax=Calycina marina TaxID=1763456 RepID=A0A9P7YZ25_9HELO|nr:Muniscin C-terminal mu homology domain-containing protein [Calycina marina]
MELSRNEYPAMLDRLQPNEAAAKFKGRVNTIGKINDEFANWVQERRKIEEEYTTKLKKLVRRPLPLQDGSGSHHLGVWDAPWKKILSSTEDIAISHQTFAQQLDKEVEGKLRSFTSTSQEFSGIGTIQANLSHIAKELEDAQEKSAKLSKKGGKANTAKVDAAAKALANANGQWEAQAPYMYEKLQLLDETRLNHLRDVFTQYETFHTDANDREAKIVQQALETILDIKTEDEVSAWSNAHVSGKPVIERSARNMATASGITALSTPSPVAVASTSPGPRRPNNNDAASERASERTSENSNRLEHSGSIEPKSKIQRFGTMFGRRRQSIHGGFAPAPSPSKSENQGQGRFGGFTRTSSRDGRPIPSPRNSSNNLRGSPAPDNRLSSLVESPTSPAHTNGVNPPAMISQLSTPGMPNGTERAASPGLCNVQPPPGPPPSYLKPESQTDSEGFTVPVSRNDPISQAQREAEEGDQPQFKLNIRNEPIPEQDADAAAALSAVTSTLRSSQAITPTRKVGTIRGRRDVRNTIYAPSGSLDVTSAPASELPLPPSPTIAMSRAHTLSSLSGHSQPLASDTASIRSGHSLSSHAIAKHHEMHGPGLNASIIETLNATFEDGEVKSATISGEIALFYNHTSSEKTSANETIRICNIGSLESIAPNPSFMNAVAADSDEYTFNLSAISSKPTSAFTYRVHLDQDNLSKQCPILLKSSWKPQGDKLGLIIDYSVNPAFGLDVTLNNLIILAFSTGPNPTGCQSKPSGIQYKDRSLVVWRLGEVLLTQESKRVVCRLTGAAGAVPEPGLIQARWELPSSAASGIGLSRLEDKGKGNSGGIYEDDPFADADATAAKADYGSSSWVDVETSNKLVGGNYEAR